MPQLREISRRSGQWGPTQVIFNTLGGINVPSFTILPIVSPADTRSDYSWRIDEIIAGGQGKVNGVGQQTMEVDRAVVFTTGQGAVASTANVAQSMAVPFTQLPADVDLIAAAGPGVGLASQMDTKPIQVNARENLGLLLIWNNNYPALTGTVIPDARAGYTLSYTILSTR